MKLKKKHLIMALLSMGIFSGLNVSDSFAKVTMTKYNISGIKPEDGTFSSAPAYTITGSEYFPDGTILYKQTYDNITYYSPKPPPDSKEAQSGGDSAKYVNWGFWDFLPNQEHNPAITSEYMFRTNEYFSEAEVTTDGALAYGCDSSGTAYSSGVALAKGTKLKVKSITIINMGSSKGGNVEWVFFDIDGTNVKSFNKIARIERKYVKKSSTEATKKVYFEEVKDRTKTVSSTNSKKCSDYYDNFKAYRTVMKRYWGSAHDQLEKSPHKVPTSVTTCNLGGKSGEWKYLGVSSKGNIVVNPYYPGEGVSFMGNASLGYYDWRYTPWDGSDYRKDERPSATSNASRKSLTAEDAKSFKDLYDSPTVFDGDTYRAKKVEVLQKIINENMKIVNGGLNGSGVNQPNLSASEWADRVSLLTNPYDETPVFVGQRRTGPYSQPFSYVVDTNDLYLYSITVVNAKGDTIATGKRSSASGSFTTTVSSKLEKGQYYVVKVKLAKKIKDNIKANNLVGELVVTNGSGNVSLSPGSKVSLSNKGGLTTSNNISNNMCFGFRVPENYSGGAYTIKANVGLAHGGVDNLEYNNDNGSLSISVTDPTFYDGDIVPVSIKVLDGTTEVYNSTNTTRKAIIPGKKYKVVYTAKYTGTSLYNKTFNGTSWVDNTNSPLKFNVPISYTLGRKTGTAQSNDSKSGTGYLVNSSNSTSLSMTSNATFTYTVNDVVLEHPYLNMTFKVTSTDKKINKDTSNDSLTKTINDSFDIQLSNVRIQPSKEFVLKTENHSYIVTYDAKLVAPTFVNSGDFTVVTTTSIDINGVTKTFKDVLKPNQLISNISHTITGVGVSTTAGPYYGEVIINSDKKAYETSTADNNRKVATITFAKVKDPSTGKASDKASTAYNGANTSATNGGDANNNCLIPRNTNSYSSTYTVYNWNTQQIEYPNFANTKNISFYKYGVSQSSITKSNKETFKIKDVLFRSKYTKDNKLGTNKDGWVSMINSTDSIIKAGYGFELKVVVEYQTNALLNNPATSNGSTSGVVSTNLSSNVNITPELFIEIPGTKDRTILSVNKFDGTKAGLSVKQTKNKVLEGSMHVYEWEYTVKGTSTSGVQSVGRIFVPETLKDGSYKLSIYTPPVAGVSSQAEYDAFKYSLLCDRKDTNVKVQGSATDDLNSHVTQ